MNPRMLERGQTLVEFAVILPLLITIALGALDMGRLFYYDVAFQNALRESARYAAKHPSTSTATLLSIMQNESGLPAGSITSVTLTNITGANSGASLEQVTATYSFTFVSPWLQNRFGIANPLSIRTFAAAEVNQ